MTIRTRPLPLSNLLFTTNTIISFTYAYYVDVSFPIHRNPLSTNQKKHFDLQHRQSFYDDFLQGCYDQLGPDDAYMCVEREEARLEHNLLQPKGMKNFTKLGFAKRKAPPELFALLKEFWELNRPSLFQPDHDGNDVYDEAVDDEYWEEEWDYGQTHVNTWESPTYMISVEDETLINGGDKLKQTLWDLSRPIIAEWTGNDKLQPSSMYGVRVYTQGAVLSPHVDRDPLISSAIINVDQDYPPHCQQFDEGLAQEKIPQECQGWPLEVYGHDGQAHNITMEPGDMVLYESHSVVHGRPFAFTGNWYANLFIHFEPVLGEDTDVNEGGDMEIELPFYIVEGSECAQRWLDDQIWQRDHPEYDQDEEEDEDDDDSYDPDEFDEDDGEFDTIDDYHDQNDEYEHENDLNPPPNPYVHHDSLHCQNGCLGPISTTSETWMACAKGDLSTIQHLLQYNATETLFQRDEDGFACLHLAASAGSVDMVKRLMKAHWDLDEKEKVMNKSTGSGGFDVNDFRTNKESDSTPLGWAIYYQGKHHPVVQLLKQLGAVEHLKRE